jgi:CRISPR-associated endoribonuclease Cas6
MKFVKFNVLSDIKAPPFIGSMVRGVLGSTLKSSVCINPSFECMGCFALDNCVYYRFYEAKNRFLNYRLDFNLNQNFIEFDYYLFNEDIEKYPYILNAIERMFLVKGVGRDRVVTKNLKILHNSQVIYENEDFRRFELMEESFQESKEVPSAVKLKLITPLRIKRQGRFVKDRDLDIKDILFSIITKKSFYDRASKEIIETFPDVISKDLRFIDFSRYSNRQRKRLKIGGIVGEMTLSNLTPQTYNLLRYGEITGVGKLNSFGLGKIEMETL